MTPERSRRAADGAAGAAAGARPHLPRGRLPARGRPDGPGPGRRPATARCRVGGRPVIPVNPGDPDAQRRPDPGPQRAGGRGGRRGHPDAGAGRGGGRADGAAAQPGRGGAARHRQGQAAAAVGSRRRGPARLPGRARRRHRRTPSAGAAAAVGFPCVVKAVSLSASQGVLRADDPAAAVAAARRIRQVLAAAGRPAARAARWSRSTCPDRS